MRSSLLLITMLVLLPLAHAGSEAAPEVSDEEGDGYAYDPESARDLVAAWVEFVEADGLFRFHAKLAGDPTHVFASLNAAQEIIRFGFTPSGVEVPEGQEMYVRMRVAAGTTSDTAEEVMSCKSGLATEDEYAEINAQVTRESFGWDGAHFWCDIPAADLGYDGNGTTLSKLHADMHLIVRGPLTGAPPQGGDNIPVTEIQHYDRAPDSGYGTDFALAAPGAPADNETVVPGNETSAVTETATGNSTGAPAEPADPCPDSSVCEEATSGNETVQDAPKDKQSPGVALPLVLALLGTVVAVRRRI